MLGSGRRRRVLLVDNYDSYTFNILHLLASELEDDNEPPLVVQNDVFGGDFEALLQALPTEYGCSGLSCIVIGPGPGNPNDHAAVNLGLSQSILNHPAVSSSSSSTTTIPVLGICLGMQAIALRFGGTVGRAPQPMHGRISAVELTTTTTTTTAPLLFCEGVDFPLQVVRYHSLSVDCESEGLLQVTSQCVADGVPMSLQHRHLPIHAVQFHPESICAGEAGRQIVANFLHHVCGLQQRRRRSRDPPSSSPPPPLSTPSRRILRVEKVTGAQYWTNDKDAQEELFFGGLFSSNTRAWLDSASGTERGGRFSIMCTGGGEEVDGEEVVETVECFVRGKRMGLADTPQELGQVQACDLRVNGRDWRCGQDPFAYLSDRIRELGVPEIQWCTPDDASSSSLPFDFACGFVGSMGYGLRKLCGVKPASIPAVAVAAVTEPAATTTPDLVFFLATGAIVLDHALGDAYVLTLEEEPGQTEQQQQHAAAARWRRRAVERLLSVASSKRARRTTTTTTTPAAIHLQATRSSLQYESDVTECLKHIQAGESYEICLTSQVRGQLPSSISPPELYCAIRRSNPAPMAAYYEFGASGLFLLSSSPERFLSVDQHGVATSRPIKGTCKRNLTDPQADAELKHRLVGSEKDRAENLMIIDLVRNDLGRVCRVGSVEVPDLIVCETFSTVHQLVSTIRGRLLPDCDAVGACRACFPPGSMTGAPKLRTMQLIDSIEVEERGFYSGALGYFSLNGACDFNVLIRTAVVVDEASSSSLSIGAGGGVVAMSTAEDERKEMQLKLATLGSSFDIHF